MLAAFSEGNENRDFVGTVLVWITFTWVGLAFYLFLYTLLRNIGFKLVERWRAATNKPPLNADRRLFLARASTGVIAGLTAFTGLGGMLQLYRPIRVRTLPIRIVRLRKNAPVFRIAQITDLHVGPLVDKRDVERVVALVNGLRPDVIAITGDLVDADVDVLRDDIAPLRLLHPRYGTFFVTGNHEYYTETDAWIDYLAELRIRTLGNERITIFHEGESIDIAGVHDWTAAQHHSYHVHDVEEALVGRPLSRPVVLLAHQPRTFKEAVTYDVDLQLSGHTHGGQIKPFHWLTRLVQPYVEGWHQENGCQLYVSPGTGFWGPPMRIGTRSEITLFELHNDSA